MGYVVSSLTNYTEENAEKVIYNQLFTGSPVLDVIKGNGNLMTGVKSAQTINVISTTPIFQSQACSLNPSGSTTFTQRTVTVGKPKIDMSWCERDLEPKFTQKKMAKGGNYDALTYLKEVIGDTMQKAAQKNRTAIWQGDTTSWNEDLNKYDGLVKIINNAVIGGTYSGTAWSSTNSRTVMQGIAAQVTADSDVYQNGNTELKAYMSPAMAYAYRAKLIADNLYSLVGTDAKQPLFIEGTTIPIVEDAGLAGLNYIYLIEDSNLHGATDMENEEEKYDVWFSKDDQKIYFHTEWKFGVNVAFPTRIYKYLGV